MRRARITTKARITVTRTTTMARITATRTITMARIVTTRIVMTRITMARITATRTTTMARIVTTRATMTRIVTTRTTTMVPTTEAPAPASDSRDYVSCLRDLVYSNSPWQPRLPWGKTIKKYPASPVCTSFPGVGFT